MYSVAYIRSVPEGKLRKLEALVASADGVRAPVHKVRKDPSHGVPFHTFAYLVSRLSILK